MNLKGTIWKFDSTMAQPESNQTFTCNFYSWLSKSSPEQFDTLRVYADPVAYLGYESDLSPTVVLTDDGWVALYWRVIAFPEDEDLVDADLEEFLVTHAELLPTMLPAESTCQFPDSPQWTSEIAYDPNYTNSDLPFVSNETNYVGLSAADGKVRYYTQTAYDTAYGGAGWLNEAFRTIKLTEDVSDFYAVAFLYTVCDNITIHEGDVAMGKPYTGLNAAIKINGVLLGYMNNVELNLEKDIAEVLQFGAQYKEKLPTIKNWTASSEGTVAFAPGDAQHKLYQAYESGEEVTLVVQLSQAVYFEGQALISSLSISGAPDDALSISAEFEGSGGVSFTLPETVTLTISSGVGGTTNPAGVVRVAKGVATTITCIPAVGYTAQGYQLNGTSPVTITGNSFSVTPTADSTIYVLWSTT